MFFLTKNRRNNKVGNLCPSLPLSPVPSTQDSRRGHTGRHLSDTLTQEKEHVTAHPEHN